MLFPRILAGARRRAGELDVPRCASGGAPASFAQALRKSRGLSVIAEFKRRSPTRGTLDPGADVGERVRLYARAGAAAMSVLTEPEFFGGSLDDLARAAEVDLLPLLMKDFIVDPRQVEAGAAAGASAVLLILRFLDDVALREVVQAAGENRLDPLLECHDENEVERALLLETGVIGVNNRDLETLEVDRERSLRLLRLVPPGRVKVAESGYASPELARPLRGRADAVLVGTALMRSRDPIRFIREILSWE